MPNFYNGDATNVPAPLTEVNIVSSTNATPTVVTTSAPHNAKTNDAVLVYGHIGNNAANGIWYAGAVTSTTVELYEPTGAPRAATGVGGATGKLRSLALGATYPLPADGEDVDAASVGAVFALMADQLAWIFGSLGWNHHIFDGGNFTLNGLAFMSLFGRTRHRDPARPADAATINVDTAMGDVILLATPVATPRQVVLRTSVNQPLDGERIRICAPPDLGAGPGFQVVRETSGVLLADIYGYAWADGLGHTGPVPSWVECQYVSGLWRGLTASGGIITGTGW